MWPRLLLDGDTCTHTTGSPGVYLNFTIKKSGSPVPSNCVLTRRPVLLQRREIYFPTMTIGDETIIEKGRLAALEDPEVRAVAAKYGDPDVLLSEDWTPRIGANGMIDWSDY